MFWNCDYNVHCRECGVRSCDIWARSFSRERGEWENSGAEEGKPGGFAAVIGHDAEAPSVPFLRWQTRECCQSCHLGGQVQDQGSWWRLHHPRCCRCCHFPFGLTAQLPGFVFIYSFLFLILFIILCQIICNFKF